MGEFSIWHWLVLIVIVMLLFGRGKVSDLMGDVAQGIKAFKKGMATDDAPAARRLTGRRPRRRSSIAKAPRLRRLRPRVNRKARAVERG